MNIYCGAWVHPSVHNNNHPVLLTLYYFLYTLNSVRTRGYLLVDNDIDNDIVGVGSEPSVPLTKRAATVFL